MNIPVLQGVIKRRILLNFRVEPEIIRNILPRGFTPKLHDNHAVAGICLIRLEEIRPKHFPGFIGVSSENAAHRIAVQWEEQGDAKEGVFVPRRDTDSLINQIAGGRVFPSEHHRAVFSIREDKGKIDYSMNSTDEEVSVTFSGKASARFPDESIFSTLKDASDFFEKGSLGYSSNKSNKSLDGIVLQIDNWEVTGLEIDHVNSSFYNDEMLFPKGTIEFDHALLMRDISHEWHSANDFKI